jgi:hypothetical protein
MATNIQSSDLDFNSIRESLKTYFEQSDEFADYNFEGSGLANILDVLAWNTHQNALVANMAINESFLETAQLRSSVVTHAQSLGYFPKSITSAKAIVKISVDLSSYEGEAPSTLTLPAGTKFNTTVDNVSYVFQTRTSYTATDDGSNTFKFVDENGSENLEIFEGTEVTKTFLVPSKTTQPIYIIPDDKLDTATIKVNVFENQNSTSFEAYTDIKDAIRITSNSRYYLLREAPNQHYELQFGPEASFGSSPSAGNKIEVNYLRSNGAASNGARSFVPQNSYTIDSQSFNISVTTQSRAGGGSARESIEKIRTSAPLSYASQRRLVTKQDYEALIASNYTSVSEVAAWGGEENNPVDYGKIYLSLIYEDGVDSDSKISIKSDITDNLITPLATMSIDPVFVDTKTIDLALTCEYDVNPNKSNLIPRAISGDIRSRIQTYFNENLNTFNGVFRRSALTDVIDSISDAILSSSISVKMVNTFTPTIGVNKSYTIDYTEELAEPDNDDYIITSELFTVNNRSVKLRNKLGSTVIQLVNSAGTEIVQRNVGSYSPASSRITIDSLTIQGLQPNRTKIKVIAVPRNQRVIRPIRNYTIGLDNDLTIIEPNIDFETTRVAL